MSSHQTSLTCVGVDSKIDEKTLVYLSSNENKSSLQRSSILEHHLTFTSESGPLTGKYLSHKTVPMKGSTGSVLAQKNLGGLRGV